ncbi:DUF1819 family protein [Hydrogenophaga sp.]|uniref:DUF1819 family protein n=1 Tax=Hydrogenophaga sp. TaxID=1904254 RepID=UPI002FCA9C7A
MTTERYRLSFTTGGLFVREAPAIVERYLWTADWVGTRSDVRAENLLQLRTAAASTRISKELIARLQELDRDELEELRDANVRDQSYLLWVAACRRYVFLREFASEVLREHYLARRTQLTVSDYDAFFNSKALWHEELEGLADSTQKKLKQNLFRMLREAGLVTPQHLIQAALLSPRIAQLIARRDRRDLFVFPVSDQEIQRWLS